MAQPAKDQVEYALDLLAFYLVPTDAFYAGCRRLGLDLQAADLRMLYHLDRRRGFYVTPDALVSARCIADHVDNWASVSVVPIAIRKIRLAFQRLGLPVTVENWKDMGYCLEAPDDFQFATPEQWGIRHAG